MVIAHCAEAGMDEEARRQLLRRVEIVVAVASIAHMEDRSHFTWMPKPHGHDRVAHFLESGPISLDEVSTDGSGYSEAKWGFLTPYLGSETRFGFVSRDASEPGAEYDPDRVESNLKPLIALAQQDQISLDDVAVFPRLCICGAALCDDGEWLAEHLTGSNPHGRLAVASPQAAAMGLIVEAMRHAPITGANDVTDFIRFHPRIQESPLLEAARVQRWRGLALRQSAVKAWRQMWSQMSEWAANEGGFIEESRLADQLADRAPNQKVREFVDSLPPSTNSKGPLNAETDFSNEVEPALATLGAILLSGRRSSELHGEQLAGFAGATPDQLEELSPHWVARETDHWASQPMADFCRALVRTLLARSQRVALAKAQWNKLGEYVVPGRVLLREGLVEWRDREPAGDPPLRIAELMSIGHQLRMFEVDEAGLWYLAERGERLAGHLL
jgi:hypothetical protein